MPKVVRTKEFLREVKRLREEEGWPFAWIAYELGVSRATVTDAYYNGFNKQQKQKSKRRRKSR